MNRITQLLILNIPSFKEEWFGILATKLAAAVSNAGGLGLIGAGSMYPDVWESIFRNVNSLRINLLA